MTTKRPIVVRLTGAHRKSPERLLIEAEDAAERIAAHRVARVTPEEEDLRAALVRFAAVVGWPTARSWLAARAHEPTPAAGATRKARRAAEALFKGRAA